MSSNNLMPHQLNQKLMDKKRVRKSQRSNDYCHPPTEIVFFARKQHSCNYASSVPGSMNQCLLWNYFIFLTKYKIYNRRR